MTWKLFPMLALAISACAALRSAPMPTPTPAVAAAPIVLEPADDAGVLDAGPLRALEELDAGPPLAEEDDEGPAAVVELGDEAPDDGEPEEVIAAATDGGFRYTNDLSDDELARRWEKDPRSLGSISIGFVEEGRMINAMPFPEGEAWTVIVPESCWTTQETADAITGAARQVRAWYPEGAPVRVGQVSGPGWIPCGTTRP